jgi:hypothetical protein
MSDSSKGAWTEIAFVIVAFIAGCIGGYSQGCKDMTEAMQFEAISNGHAEYYIDENHNKQWRWLEAARKETSHE